MATGLEDRGNESIATARLNEAKPVPKPKDNSAYGLVAGAKEKLAKARADNQSSDARKREEEYSWAEKVASNVAIPLGAAEGLLEVADYAFGDATGTEDAHYRSTSDHFLDRNEVRKKFLANWAEKNGEESAKKLELEDREFLKNVTVDQPKILKDQNLPTTRSLEGGVISDFLGHTVNEGFDKSPLYRADPEFWGRLKDSGSQWYKDLEKGYDDQYEFKRKQDFPAYGTFVEAHKIFTDEIASLVKKDASMMQGWEEDFLAMGAGTIEFLSQIAGFDDDQVGLTPWQQRWEAGKMLTGGLAGTAVAALQVDKDNKVMGIPLPQLARKPAILAAFIGPGLVRALGLGKNTALGKAIANKRAADPSFDAFMRKAEGVRGRIGSAVAGSAIGKAVKAVGDIELPIKIRDTSLVVKEGGTKAAKYSEDVSGAVRQRKIADLAKSGAKGALYWAWSGAPQLGLLHPLAGSLHGVILNSSRYRGLLDGARKQVSRSADKAQSDFELAEQVGQAESTVAQASSEARSTAAAFVLGLDQVNQYGAQKVGELSVLDSPRFTERIQKGEGVLGSDTIAGLPAGQVILPPNANLPTSSTPTPAAAAPAVAPVAATVVAPAPVAGRTPPPKGGEPLPKESKARAPIDPDPNPPKGYDPINDRWEGDVSPQPPSFDQAAYTNRYTMELPDGQKVRIISEAAQVLDNQSLTRDIVLAEAVRLKLEIRKELDRLVSNDAVAAAVIKEALAESKPLFEAVGGTEAMVSEWGMGPDAQFGLQFSDPVPGRGSIPNPTAKLEMQWANRARLEQMFLKTHNYDMIDVAAREFLNPDLPTEFRGANASAAVNTAKDVFAGMLEGEQLRLYDESWGKDGPGGVMMKAMYKNYGRSAVDGAINLQRKRRIEERGAWGEDNTPATRTVDPEFPMTWDGAIVDGTPLATLVKEGGFPRKVAGSGEYMARPYKRSDKTLTEREGRNTEMTDHYEQMGREPSDPGDITGFRSDDLSYADQSAKDLTETMRKERAEPLDAIDKKFDKASDKGWKKESRGKGRSEALANKEKQEFVSKRKGREAADRKAEETKASSTTRSPKELAREDAARESIDRLKSKNKNLLDKTKDSEFSGEALASRRAKRLAVYDKIQSLWEGKESKAEARGAKTTIDSPNRKRDAARVRKEHPDLTEQGNKSTVFTDKNGEVLATGYDRVVYGDHGPYIEFSRDNMRMEAFPGRNKRSFYDEGYTSDKKVKLYIQKRDVSTGQNLRKNPPAGKYSVSNNRPEGYADYKPGKFYISPDQVSVQSKSVAVKPRLKKARKPVEKDVTIKQVKLIRKGETKEGMGFNTKALVLGNFAVHKSLRATKSKPEWTVTHLPSGYMFPPDTPIPLLKNNKRTDSFLKKEAVALIVELDRHGLSSLSKDQLIESFKRGDIKKVGAKAQSKKAIKEDLAAKPEAVSKTEKWYTDEFTRITKQPNTVRSGFMHKHARRLFKDDKISFEFKQAQWKAMIKGKDPHISPKFGMPDKPGGMPRTDDPIRYRNWHEQIEGYIKGEKPKESLANSPPIPWQGLIEGAGKTFADQLTADITKIEKTKGLTPGQRLSALNDIKNNILDDLYEGRRDKRSSRDYKESDFMSALGEVRKEGEKAVLSRIGTAAINRAAETGQTVAKEVSRLMETLNSSIELAKQASLKDPKSRASKATVQARNIWEGKDVSGVTPEFVRLVRDLKAKVNRAKKNNREADFVGRNTRDGKNKPRSLEDGLQILRYTDILELEKKAFEKNLPSHEQTALSAIAKKVVAADEARAASAGVEHIAKEVGVNRKAERNRIETSVAAIKEATPEPPPVQQPVQQPKVAAKPEPAPTPKAKGVVKERDYKRVDRAVVPTWVVKDLTKKLKMFRQDAWGLSKVKAEAITAGFSDVWTQGLTMLASNKARALVYEKILSKIEADGVTLTKTFKKNLEKQVNTYLDQFRSPFKGRERMAEYSLDLPGPESAMGIIEVAQRTLPDDFNFKGDVWSGRINVKDAFFEALGDLKKNGKNKDIDAIQKEAFIELGNQFAAQVQVLAQNKIINGEMSRLGITRDSSPLQAAARIAVHRLLYQEALPLGLFNRLRQETVKIVDGVEVKEFSPEPISMKDLADVMRTNRAFIVEAMKTEILSARFAENKGYVNLTEKQIRRVMLEQDGPLQKIADALDKYEYRSKIEGAEQLNSLFKEVIDPDGEYTSTPGEAKKRQSTEPGMLNEKYNETLDYTYNEGYSDQVFNASFNPEYLDSMLYNARLAQDQGRFSNLISGMKGNVTYESLMTNLGNGLGHSLVTGLLTGELPTTFYSRVAHEMYLFNEFNNNPKEFTQKYGKKHRERLSAYNDLSKYGALEGMDWGSVEAAKAGPVIALGLKAKGYTPAGKKVAAVAKGTATHLDAYRNLRRKIYQLEDNGPRVAEAVREHIEISREMALMEHDAMIVLPTGKKGMSILTKGKMANSVDGTGFYRGTRELKRSELAKVKASYAMRKVAGRIFNYKEVPRFIKSARSGGWGAFGAFVTPFLSFPYLSIDVPGVKKGIFSAVFGDGLTGSSGFTNSPKLTAYRAKQMAAQRMRVLAWGLNMNQFSHPLNNDLDEMTRFNMEAGGTTAAMIRSSQKNNTIGVWRWNNANIFEASLLLMRNVFAMQAQMATWIGGDRVKSNKNVEYFMRLAAEGKVLEKNDVVRIAGLSGNLFMRSIIQALPKQGNQDKGWGDMKAAFGHIGGSLIGVDDWNAVRTAAPMMGMTELKDPVFSSFSPMVRDLEETGQLNFEDMDPQDQMDFMVGNWFKAFSRLYLRQRKISGGDQVNNQSRIALAAFKRQMLVPLEAKIKVTRGLERERLVALKSMTNLSHSRLVEAYTDFYRAVSELEGFKRGRTKEQQASSPDVRRSKIEVNNLRKSLEEARSKAVGALRDSKSAAKKAEELREAR
tara:strand:- start:148 stop:8907 length:8760 start_codon:yes stop_codon:yes gene_type:complete